VPLQEGFEGRHLDNCIFIQYHECRQGRL
jgi:hypothetical protein